MQMIAVTDPSIAAIGYEPLTQTLRVQFPDRKGRRGAVASGGLYELGGITQGEYDALMAASQIGVYWHQNFQDHPKYVVTS